jgi:PAS domain S-box-containing protein
VPEPDSRHPAGGADMSKVARTKRKRAWEGGEALQNQLLSGSILSALDAIVTVDSEQRIVLFNPAAEKMFQIGAQEAVGQPLARFIRPDGKDDEKFTQTRVAKRQTGWFKVVKGLRADGAEFPVEASIYQVRAGNCKFYTAILRDISERVQAEELVRESGQRLRLAVDTAKLGTYERDLLKNQIILNDACREILGLPEGAPSVDLARQSAHPEDRERVLAAVARAFDPARREVCAAEFRIRRADGTVRWVAGRGRVIFDDTITPAQPLKFLGVLLDITERKLAEAEALRIKQELTRINAELEQRVEERTAKLQEVIGELEHMSYSMIHDMRAPLRAIQSFGAILEKVPQIRLNEEAYQLVAKMRTASLRMDQLLTGALNYSEAVRKPLPLDRSNVLQVLRDLLVAHPEFQLPHAEVSFEGSFPFVLANEPGLMQCFAELIRNGIKFVEPGKLPRVRVWAKQIQNLKRGNVHEVTSGAGDNASGKLPGAGSGWVRVYFEDNGTGIPKNAQARIFDMFQRLHGPEYPGTGIGLALAHKVIENMGGRIGVESEEGKGSRFWLELPQLPERQQALVRMAA